VAVETVPRTLPGAASTATAVVGLFIGVVGAYCLLHNRPAPQIILRQSLDPIGVIAQNFFPTPANASSPQLAVSVRNDGTAPVEVSGATAGGRTTGPPIAPATIAPGGQAYVYLSFPSPNGCTSTAPVRAAAVLISVFASPVGGAVQQVPVEVTGDLAALIARCEQ